MHIIVVLAWSTAPPGHASPRVPAGGSMQPGGGIQRSPVGCPPQQALRGLYLSPVVGAHTSNDYTFKGAKCYHIYGAAKSGTTWLTTLLEECAKRNCCEDLQAKVSELCDRRHGSCQSISNVKHHRDQKELLQAYGKAIFLFRDTRDVVTSNFHWERGEFTNLRDFSLSMVGSMKVIMAQNSLLSIMDTMQKLKPGKGTMTTYEDLQADTYGETVRLAGFLGMTLTRRHVLSAVNASSFDSMREKEFQGTLHLKVHPNSGERLQKALARNVSSDQLFGVMTRKAKVGGWRDEMDSFTQNYVEKDMRSNLDKRLLRRFLPDATAPPRDPGSGQWRR